MKPPYKAIGVDEMPLTGKAHVVKEQCRKVAQTGKVDMLDSKAVFELALEMGLCELADFIFMNTKAYGNFIHTGELTDAEIIEFP